MPEPLHVEPGVVSRAAALCDDAAAELAELAAELDHVPCGDHPVRSLLQRLAETLSEFAPRFRAVDTAYRDADSGSAGRFPRG